MDTNGVTGNLASLPDVGIAAKAPTKELGKDEFLLLLTTQLQNQDPLEPVDNQAFIAQLAQFASVEQLEGLGSRLDTLLLAQASANQMNTAALVGKEILFRADGITLGASPPARFEVTQDGPSDATVALVADRNGKVVRTLQLGPRSAGTFEATWDGRDEKGNLLPPGDYVLTASATREDGQEVQVASSIRGVVSGVTFENQAPELLVGGRRVQMSDVVQIATTPAGA
jgi:flagellar basal-body rod modification protein FlgD